MINYALIPDWEVCFLRAEEIFYSQMCALGKTTPRIASPHEMGQILRASLAVARMAVFLRALQTFQSGTATSLLRDS